MVIFVGLLLQYIISVVLISAAIMCFGFTPTIKIVHGIIAVLCLIKIWFGPSNKSRK